jgi:hypothetical protein
MTIKVKVLPRFPSSVAAEGPVVVTKTNGFWTFSLDVSLLGQIGVIDPSVLELIAFDTSSGALSRIPITLIQASSSAPRTITAAGDINATNFDTFIRLNKTVPATTNIILPPSSNRDGLPLTVKDVAGNAASFNYTITPAGTEKIDGLSSYVGTMNFQSITLIPGSSGWDVTHSG